MIGEQYEKWILPHRGHIFQQTSPDTERLICVKCDLISSYCQTRVINSQMPECDQ